MGDWFQNLVASDVAAAEAKATGDRMLSWLIAQEIISAETKDCVLGPNLGHPPGRHYDKATGITNAAFPGLRSNGMAVITKRTVFHSGQGGFELICFACKSKFGPPENWSNAVGEWFAQRGPGVLPCPVCGVSRPIVEWQHDPPWAFGELGFKFWNWPQFIRAFIKEFEEQLGSRVVLVWGKL